MPAELTTEIPDFVKNLQEISRQYRFNNDLPSREEVISHLAQLKNRKSSNDIPPEILKHARHSSKFMYGVKGPFQKVGVTARLKHFGRVKVLN